MTATPPSAEPYRAGAGGGAYFPAIDGLRAIAVLAVVAFHLRPERLPGGFAGVDVFFVISGFVVTASLARYPVSSLRGLVAYFYARRSVRILPALLAMLLVVSAASTYFVRYYALDLARSVALPAFLGASNVALAFSGNGYFAPVSSQNPFLHTWTLGVEEQFYLVFPFLFYTFRGSFNEAGGSRRGFRIVAAASLLSLALCAILSSRRADLAFYLMPARFWELGAGVALCLSMPRWRPALSRAGGPAAGAAAAVLLGALAYSFLDATGHRSPFPSAILPVAAAAGLIALVCARPGSLPARALSHAAPVFVGRLSYSLYLWHWPVFVLFQWTIGLDGTTHALAALGLSGALAAASYFLIEQPLRRSPRVKGQRRRVILACGTGGAFAAALVALGIFQARSVLSAPTAHAAYWEGAPPARGCALEEVEESFHGGVRRGWVPRCPVPGSRGTLWVIGDSHAVAFERMLRRHAAEAPSRVTLIYRYGCPIPRIGHTSTPAAHCAAFRDGVVPAVAGEMKEGDVLFLPGLRIPHLSEFWSGAPAAQSTPAPRELETAYREASAILRALSRSGAHIVLEAPPPMFRASAFRCSDWFNRSNPACRGGLEIGRDEMLRHRAPVVALMERLAAGIPGVSVWDPFFSLCPGPVCSVMSAGGPLYVDANHLSGHAGDLLLPSFQRAVERPVARVPR